MDDRWIRRTCYLAKMLQAGSRLLADHDPESLDDSRPVQADHDRMAL